MVSQQRNAYEQAAKMADLRRKGFDPEPPGAVGRLSEFEPVPEAECRPLEIRQSVSSIVFQIEQLESLAGNLAGRLEPICSFALKESGADEVCSPSRVPLAQELDSIVIRLGDLGRILFAILNGLEL